MRDFFRRVTLVLCVGVLLGSAHVSFADGLEETEAFFAAPEQYSALVDVPGRGLTRYYAQNDPLWNDLVYESDVSTRRPFGDGGCSPTAMAMAVAALVPSDQLRTITSLGKRTFSLCSCSVNKGRCLYRHSRYVLTSDLDFTRFLPLIFADIATGNNTAGVTSRNINRGTATGYLWEIAKAYHLNMRFTPNLDQALTAVRNGASVIGLNTNGVFTRSGHYVFIASTDEEKVYFLDPLLREKYNTNNAHRLEIIQPGLVALKMKDLKYAQFINFVILTKEN